MTGDRRSNGPAIDISSSRASCPTSPRGALASMDSRSARAARAAISVWGTRSIRMPTNKSTCSIWTFAAPCRNSSLILRAASARRLGSPFLTISSSPGISEVATVIKRTQTRRIAKFRGNLGWLGEGRVRFGTVSAGAQNRGLRASRALPDEGKTVISPPTFGISYDRVLRVGPPGPALFYYPNQPDAGNGAGRGPGSTAGPLLRPGPNSTEVRPPLTLDMTDPTAG